MSCDDDQVTITVSRKDVEDVYHKASLTCFSPYGAVQRIHAALPPKPWTPSEEQIKAYCDWRGLAVYSWGKRTVESLQRLHDLGWELTRVQQ